MHERASILPVSVFVHTPIHHVIAMGASAGGLHSLMSVLSSLPPDLNGCIAIATHLSETHNSVLPELLARHSAMPVYPAGNHLLQNGAVFVATPRFHLTVSDDHFRLLDDPPVRFLRPNIDLLFHSVASQYGNRGVAIVLSGTGRDGAEGIRAIKAAGGITIIEDPADAEFADMPIAANRTGCVDFILPLSKIGERLVEICSTAS